MSNFIGDPEVKTVIPATGGVTQGVLSLIIVCHFWAVLLAPNFDSYLGTQTGTAARTYLNFFGLLSTWGFFAPDPGPPPIHIEYAVMDKKGHTLETGAWPPPNESLIFREQQNRRITAARFMFTEDSRAAKMMIPYVCNKVSGAWSVHLWKTVKYQPSFSEIVQNPSLARSKVNGNGQEENKQWIADSFCDAAKL
jgi:hypothetical protein